MHHKKKIAQNLYIGQQSFFVVKGSFVTLKLSNKNSEFLSESRTPFYKFPSKPNYGVHNSINPQE